MSTVDVIIWLFVWIGSCFFQSEARTIKLKHTSCKISALFSTVHVCVLVYMSVRVCLRGKGVQLKTSHCDLSLQATATDFHTQTELDTKMRSVSTCCYHPGLSATTELLQSDNVALTHLWTMYPLPHCFGTISKKWNMIVCTCRMLKQSFPNKTQTLSTAGESTEKPTHPQTPLTQTTWRLSLPKVILCLKWRI